jgi:hypothetical protein
MCGEVNGGGVVMALVLGCLRRDAELRVQLAKEIDSHVEEMRQSVCNMELELELERADKQKLSGGRMVK